MAQNTSTLLTETRDVLYGDKQENVTLQDMFKILSDVSNRIGKIEKGMSEVSKMNRTLSTLASNFDELKIQVSNIESTVKNVKSKCDKQESDISKLKTNQSNTEKDVSTVQKDVKNIQSDMQGLSDFMDDFKLKHESNVQDVKQMRSSVSKIANDLEDQAVELRGEIKSALSDIREENEDLRSTVIDLQCRSMKNNLVFTGINEFEKENTEEVIRGFIKRELRITHFVEFGNVHRFGSGVLAGKRGRPRPIVARFIYHNDLARVLSNTYRLKGKSYGVNRQYPDVIEQARKSLYPIVKKKRDEGHNVRLVRDVLYVDGEVYRDQYNDSVTHAKSSYTNSYTTPDNRPNLKRRRTSTPNHG